MNVYDDLDFLENKIIIEFFNRLESDLQQVNLLQKGVMPSY